MSMLDHTDDLTFGEEVSLAPLEADCSLLANLLDDCCRMEVGDELMSKLGVVRTLAESSSSMFKAQGVDDAGCWLFDRLQVEIKDLLLDEKIALARACTHYLNLCSIAETNHRVRRLRSDPHSSKSCDEVFGRIIAAGHSQEALFNAIMNQQVEVVLTAHPTQVNRRTLQYKHTKLAALLEKYDRPDLTPEEKDNLIEEVVRELTSLWQTDELRRRKPTPMDEARGGLYIVEQSLWTSVPAYLRRLSSALKKHSGKPLPLDAVPLKFGSWMGGDRDGNPNVTSRVTLQVCWLAKWMACDLYLREVDALRFELSMSTCNDEIMELVQTLERSAADHEPPSSPSISRRSSNDSHGVIVASMGMLATTQPVYDKEGTENIPVQIPEVQKEDDLGDGDVDEIPVLVTFPPPQTSQSTSKPQSILKAKGKKPKPPPGKTTIDKVLNPKSILANAPYRVVLGEVREKLLATRKRMEDLLAGNTTASDDMDDNSYRTLGEFQEPLLKCYRSLWDTGAGILAEGRLLDVIRRSHVFGFHLMKLDLRQEAARHTQLLNTVTEYLGLGLYSDWTEHDKLDWLKREIEGKRPLISPTMPMSEDARERALAISQAIGAAAVEVGALSGGVTAAAAVEVGALSGGMLLISLSRWVQRRWDQHTTVTVEVGALSGGITAAAAVEVGALSGGITAAAAVEVGALSGGITAAA
ncbi:phosphoenolpyruvate carboxylase, partial [Cymbomonas tetramitiformis]